MHEGVTISHRGSSYAIGSGRGYYGIWLASAPLPHPVEWWPQTTQGWQDAWTRFTTLEAPGAIIALDQAEATQPSPAAGDWPSTVAATGPASSGTLRVIAPALLAIGVALGVAGLFPNYLGGASLAKEPAELVPHAIYLAAWAVSAALMLGGSGRRAMAGGPARGVIASVGALAAIGISAVSFGLFFADLGTAISSSAPLAGAGLLLSLVGWLACAAGSAIALSIWRPGSPRRARGRESVLALTLTTFAVLGAAIAFAPSWDSYTLRTAAGTTDSITAGNAFANAGPVIFGDVAVMAVLVAVVIVAAAWQPVRLGAALLAGAIVPMVAQAISAVVQVGEAPSPLEFGFSQAQARLAGLTITSGLTPAFWVYCAFVLAVALIGARMLTTPNSVSSAAEGNTGFADAGATSALPPRPA